MIDHEQVIAETALALVSLRNLRDVIRVAYFKGVLNGQVEGLANRQSLVLDWPIGDLWMIYGR
jgi:hypothetical protein